MTYRFPRTLPYLTGLFSAVLIGGFFLGPSPRASMMALGYAAFALLPFGAGILSQRYTVTIAADRLVIRFFRRKEYLFADMTKLEVIPDAKGVRVAVVTMKYGTRVNVSGSLRDFDGFVRALRDSAHLTAPASNNRWRGP